MYQDNCSVVKSPKMLDEISLLLIHDTARRPLEIGCR